MTQTAKSSCGPTKGAAWVQEGATRNGRLRTV